MKDFEIFEHTADVGVRVYGKTHQELFENAAQALFNLLVDFKVRQTKEREVNLEADTLEELLVNWLGELISMFFADKFLPARYNISIEDRGALKALKVKIRGQDFNPYEKKIKMEVKAATRHNLKIERTKQGFKAEIIFDV